MGGRTHAGLDKAVQRLPRHRLGPRPVAGVRSERQRAVAGEAELAARATGRTLEDHAADRVGIGGMTHPVEDHLGHRPLALQGLASRLVIDGLGQAAPGLAAILSGGPQDEGLHGGDGQGREGAQGVDLPRRPVKGRPEAQGRQGGDVVGGPARNPSPVIGPGPRIMAPRERQHGRVHVGGEPPQPRIGQIPRHQRHTLRGAGARRPVIGGQTAAEAQGDPEKQEGSEQTGHAGVLE